MAGFTHVSGGEEVRGIIIANSAVITVGDLVAIDADGFAALVGAGNPVLGLVVGITTKEGIAPSSNGAGGNFSDTLTVAADNETVAQYKAQVLLCRPGVTKIKGTADAALSTTGDVGDYYDVVAASDTVDEDSATTSGQLFRLEDVSGSTTQAIFTVAESQLQL